MLPRAKVLATTLMMDSSSVGEDGAGTGEVGGIKLQRHEDGAHRHGEHDSGEAHSKIGGIRQIHNGSKESFWERGPGVPTGLESLCH